MRKYNFILMAFALLLGMAQCKKEPATPNGDNNGGVRITLKVDDGPSTPSTPSTGSGTDSGTDSGTESGTDDGEKLNVYPATGAVIFTQGDKIYVGNNGKYVGTLTFDNGLFQGTINDDLCSTTDYLHFYFVGNKPTSPATLTASTTTYTVNISDQSTGLPAISYAPSTAKYSPSTTAYTAKLLNKSALVKFVPSEATSQPITVSGLNNEVQIDFANHTLAPTGNTGGGITLYSESESEKWAILLEQASLSGLTVLVDGYDATIEGLPESITNNMYYNSGVGISMTATYQTFVVTSTNPETTIASFNAAEPIPTPKLFFNTNYGDGLTLTRANGIVDFNGHSANELFIQNDVKGESITFQNGTITPKPIDGSNQGFYYKGTVILENMTVNGRIFTDGHAFIINSGTYNDYIYCDTNSDCPGTTTIYGGYFTSLGFWTDTHGTYILYGGKYKNRPNDAWCAAGYTIISNQDDDKVTYPWVVTALPEGALKGEFTINDNGGKVFFSKGNLQYIGSAATPYWKFAENQWDYLGNNGQGSSATNVDRDLFGWGTSGWTNGNTYYRPWDTNNSSGSSYGPLGQYDLTGSYANADWGVYNPISNGGGQAGQWRTLTREEWVWVLGASNSPSPGVNCRTSSTVNGTPNARYAKGQVAGVHGLIVFPDSYTHPSGVAQPVGINGNTGWNGNDYSSTDFGLMQANGAVFLPAAGQRRGTSVDYVGSEGYYWSASYNFNDGAFGVLFESSGLYPPLNVNRCYGPSVRLVRNVE